MCWSNTLRCVQAFAKLLTNTCERLGVLVLARAVSLRFAAVSNVRDSPEKMLWSWVMTAGESRAEVPAAA